MVGRWTAHLTAVAKAVRAGRLHQAGSTFQIDEIPAPVLDPRDVIVRVKACGVVPNLKAVTGGRYWHTLPPRRTLPDRAGLAVPVQIVDAIAR